eukprot:4916774-Pyramimonas_sp.AAC.2
MSKPSNEINKSYHIGMPYRSGPCRITISYSAYSTAAEQRLGDKRGSTSKLTKRARSARLGAQAATDLRSDG